MENNRLKVELKSFNLLGGDWMGKDEALGLIGAYTGSPNAYRIMTDKLSKYIEDAQADEIVLFYAQDGTKRKMVVICFKGGAPVYYKGNGKEEVLQHIIPEDVDPPTFL